MPDEEVKPGGVVLGNLHRVIAREPRATVQQALLMEKIDVAAKEFINVILMYAPECQDRTAALRAVREARMWANVAISLKGEV